MSWRCNWFYPALSWTVWRRFLLCFRITGIYFCCYQMIVLRWNFYIDSHLWLLVKYFVASYGLFTQAWTLLYLSPAYNMLTLIVFNRHLWTLSVDVLSVHGWQPTGMSVERHLRRKQNSPPHWARENCLKWWSKKRSHILSGTLYKLNTFIPNICFPVAFYRTSAFLTEKPYGGADAYKFVSKEPSMKRMQNEICLQKPEWIKNSSKGKWNCIGIWGCFKNHLIVFSKKIWMVYNDVHI